MHTAFYFLFVIGPLILIHELGHFLVAKWRGVRVERFSIGYPPRLFGFRRAIAHGLWTQARALAALLPREPVAQAQVTVEFKTPLFLPARASLWTSRDASGPYSRGALFEVRNDKGERLHLRGRLSCQ